MTGSSNGRTSISASMSEAPSLATSLHSFASTSKLSLNNAVKSPVQEENVVADLLEKAKFYTSLCLGENPTATTLCYYQFIDMTSN